MKAEINPAEQAVVLTEFDGLRNDVAPELFEAGDLVEATNVDIDGSKHIRRRSGHSAAVLAGDYEWMWTDGERAWAVRSGTALVELSANVNAYSQVRSDLTPGLRMVYASPAPGYVYYSNGAQRGAIVTGRHRTWGLEKPPHSGVYTLVGGGLPAGTYRYLVTFVRTTGEESGAPLSQTVEVATGQGVKLTGIPMSSDPDVMAKKVYFSAPNGETVYWIGTIPNDQTEFWYVSQLPLESPCPTEHLGPPPLAYELTSYGGWMFAATDTSIRISEPYQWDLWDGRKGYHMGARPRLLAAVNDGVYAGTDTGIFWLSGRNAETLEFQMIADYGVIPGTVSVATAEQVGGSKGPAIIFATTRGICVAMDGGEIKNVTRGRFAYPVQDRGAGVVRVIRGVPQYVVTLQGTEQLAPEAFREHT